MSPYSELMDMRIWFLMQILFQAVDVDDGWGAVFLPVRAVFRPSPEM